MGFTNSLIFEGMRGDPSAQIVMLRNAIDTDFTKEVEEVFPELIKICGDREATLCYNLTKDNGTTIRGRLSYLKSIS